MLGELIFYNRKKKMHSCKILLPDKSYFKSINSTNLLCIKNQSHVRKIHTASFTICIINTYNQKDMYTSIYKNMLSSYDLILGPCTKNNHLLTANDLFQSMV